MPHDKNGQLLTAGDHVTMEFIVTDVFAHEEYCNMNLASVEPLYPGNGSTNLSAVNAKQVVKITHD